MTIDEVNAAMAAGTTVFFTGSPVTITNVQENRVYARQGITVWDVWIVGSGIDTVTHPEDLSATA